VAPSTKAKSPKVTVDGLEECIAVNHLGHFLLANLLRENLASSPAFGGVGGRLIVTASSVHDPEAPGGAIGGKGGATLGDLSGFGIRFDGTSKKSTMPDGEIEYDGGKIYKDSKLCNVLFCREARKRWDTVAIRAFNPGFIPSSGLFREPRKDNWLRSAVFVFAMSAIGVAVPSEVGGERLAYMALADDSEIPPGSYYSSETGSRACTRADGFGPASMSKEAMDDALATKLWETSMQIVGL